VGKEGQGEEGRREAKGREGKGRKSKKKEGKEKKGRSKRDFAPLTKFLLTGADVSKREQLVPPVLWNSTH